jgi:hypothetical protein
MILNWFSINIYMKIIGLEGCPKCVILKQKYPDFEYIEIPRLSLGFGDTVAKLTCFFGIQTCKACRIRQYKFNKWIPYSWRSKQIDNKIINAKNFAYQMGIKEFPILVDEDLTKIIELGK